MSISILKNKISDSYQTTTDYVADSVRRELERIEHISDYLYCDSEVKRLLTDSDTSPYEHMKCLEGVETSLNTLIMTTSSFQNCELIQLRDLEGNIVLNYTANGNSIYIFDQTAITKQLFNDPEKISRSFSLKECPVSFYRKNYSNDKLLVETRQILDSSYRNEIGQLMISFRTNTFTAMLPSFDNKTKGHLYVLDNSGQIVNTNNSQFNTDLVLEVVNHPESQNGPIKSNQDLVFVKNIEPYGWKIINIIPISQLTQDNNIILYAVLLGLITSLIIGGILWYVLAYNIYKPLGELKKAVFEVERGNLQTSAPVISHDEFGELAVNFNHMVSQINDLFNKVVDEQKRLKTAQFQALQAQINPHFLYNTLSSIRWMAIIHKADNIKTMVEALARLLRSQARLRDEAIRIREEIESVKDYLFIQKLAYGCKFDVVWDIPAEIEDDYCLSFILQPLVENAILHGINPKQTQGLIVISAKIETWRESDHIVFCIHDNGVGISEDKIHSLLRLDPVHNKRGLNSIGIANVNERLRLTYGAEYQLEFESKPNEFTTVTVRIPLIEEIAEKEENDFEDSSDC